MPRSVTSSSPPMAGSCQSESSSAWATCTLGRPGGGGSIGRSRSVTGSAPAEIISVVSSCPKLPANRLRSFMAGPSFFFQVRTSSPISRRDGGRYSSRNARSRVSNARAEGSRSATRYVVAAEMAATSFAGRLGRTVSARGSPCFTIASSTCAGFDRSPCGFEPVTSSHSVAPIA